MEKTKKKSQKHPKLKMHLFKIVFGMLLFAIVATFSFGNYSTIESFNKDLPEHNDSRTIDNLKENGCIVLNYHRIQKKNKISNIMSIFVHNNNTKYYSVSLENFEKQMQYLHDNNIPVFSEKELLTRLETKTIPKYCATITFDDVDSTVYENAFPVLKKFNFPFSVYQIIGHTGEYFKGYHLSSWEELKEMRDSGLASIGLHTYDMHYIDPQENKPPFLLDGNGEWFEEDLTKSIDEYRDNMGEEPFSFAYPFGMGLPHLDKILAKKNIKLRYSLYPGVISQTFDFQNIEDELPRFLVTNDNFDMVEKAFDLMKKAPTITPESEPETPNTQTPETKQPTKEPEAQVPPQEPEPSTNEQ